MFVYKLQEKKHQCSYKLCSCNLQENNVRVILLTNQITITTFSVDSHVSNLIGPFTVLFQKLYSDYFVENTLWT